MGHKEKRAVWSTSADLVRSFSFKTGVQDSRLDLLTKVWDKELGHFSKYWSLSGVKKGILYVNPRSAAAAHELQLRSGEIVRSLNKYFMRPWIKAVKSALK
ncbi:MAG: DUF721 domain-containing protein [Elusimicrobia bacterium]|nr:DUF721 domain-containing protein [Elusimicrobiota bacterium]MDE2237832.1 DUF721 domain-containing protein [Elusimicrobiota bacterium]MDE2424399.1 DUF721 domain-containing protein [Elusimicrobiota bacterium]